MASARCLFASRRLGAHAIAIVFTFLWSKREQNRADRRDRTRRRAPISLAGLRRRHFVQTSTILLTLTLTSMLQSRIPSRKTLVMSHLARAASPALPVHLLPQKISASTSASARLSSPPRTASPSPARCLKATATSRFGCSSLPPAARAAQALCAAFAAALVKAGARAAARLRLPRHGRHRSARQDGKSVSGMKGWRRCSICRRLRKRSTRSRPDTRWSGLVNPMAARALACREFRPLYALRHGRHHVRLLAWPQLTMPA